MRAYLPLLAAAALCACTPPAEEARSEAPPAAAPEATAFTATDLTALIAARGPDGALDDLFETPADPRWQAVLDGLSAGDQTWIDAVAPLEDVLDGEAAESVMGSLSQGLAHNASGVLRFAGVNGREQVCYRADPSTEPDADAFNEARYAAVEAVADEDLAALRYECLIQISGEPT